MCNKQMGGNSIFKMMRLDSSEFYITWTLCINQSRWIGTEKDIIIFARENICDAWVLLDFQGQFWWFDVLIKKNPWLLQMWFSSWNADNLHSSYTFGHHHDKSLTVFNLS